MALFCQRGQMVLNTATGAQSFTELPFQPSVIIFYYAHTGGLGENSDRCRIMLGAAVSSAARWAMSSSSRGAVLTTVADSRFDNTSCFTLYDNGTVSSEGDFVSMDSVGFTIDITTAPTGTRILDFIAFGGSDVRAFVGTFNTQTTAGAQSITGLAFRPNVVLFGNSLDTTTIGNQVDAQLGFGMVVERSAGVCAAMRGEDAAAAGDEQRSARSDRCMNRISNTAETFSADFAWPNPTGFTIDLEVADATSRVWGYIALQVPKAALGVITQPTSPGQVVVSGIDVRPKGVIFLGINSVTEGFTADSEFSFGATSGPGEEISHGAASLNAADPTEVTRTRDAGCHSRIGPQSGDTDVKANYKSHDPSGFTLDFGTVDATARGIGYLAIGETPFSPAPSQRSLLGVGV